jgi:UDP-N-acetylmuramate--alanine ligase
LNFDSSVRYGAGPWIIESDESDRSFLCFHPDHAIITNISEDHFKLPELIDLFGRFEQQVSGYVIREPDTFPELNRRFSLPGKHNLENAAHALSLCKRLGLKLDQATEALLRFKGIERRLEQISPRVIDDFAHSPIKIEAALNAAAEAFDSFCAVWRPHGFTPLHQGKEAFCDTFQTFYSTHPECRLFILPVYYAGGTVEAKLTAEEFVEELKKNGIPVEHVDTYSELEQALLAEKKPVLMMGARDPELPRFARRISKLLAC